MDCQSWCRGASRRPHDRDLPIHSELAGSVRYRNTVTLIRNHRKWPSVLWWVGILAAAANRCPMFSQETGNSHVLTCSAATGAHVGQRGITYVGSVRNEDYRFEARVPEGLKGLGSASGAPFH